ncbi:hypothetical protein GOODEAATRI_018661 [Goodea atripinnis]|uniref:Uncharacterized protein n=1 Tax=Goodea atripinnis TaxID=208336 RepID=A0ABV0MTA3_9TELE
MCQKIAVLESRVAEQYTSTKGIIVTGLEINPLSYAEAVVVGNDKECEQNSKQQSNFLVSKGIKFNKDNMINKYDKPAIIIRLVNQKKEIELLKQGRKLKGSDVYLNKHLTKQNIDNANKGN